MKTHDLNLSKEIHADCYLICTVCDTKIYPFKQPKRCVCGNLQVDEEKSTDMIIHLKERTPPKIEVTPSTEPTFKEKIMDMFKGKNNLC